MAEVVAEGGEGCSGCGSSRGAHHHLLQFEPFPSSIPVRSSISMRVPLATIQRRMRSVAEVAHACEDH
ncbi:MAG: hypothetical protein ACXQTL_03480 [Methanosarcinales archaeon]